MIGADAGPDAVVMESGSPNVHVEQLDVPIDAIRTRAGPAVKVGYERGSMGVRALPAVPAAVLQPPSHQGQGLEGTYFGTPYFWSKVATRVDTSIQSGADPGVPEAPPGMPESANLRAVAPPGRSVGEVGSCRPRREAMAFR